MTGSGCPRSTSCGSATRPTVCHAPGDRRRSAGCSTATGLQKSIDPAPSAAPVGSLPRWALDIDNDGLLWDDERDADADGLSNSFEVHRPGDYLTDAFGPPAPGPTSGPTSTPSTCKPVRSERCHRSVPFGYYDSDQAPPVGNLVPAGFPGSGVPPTPDN